MNQQRIDDVLKRLDASWTGNLSKEAAALIRELAAERNAPFEFKDDGPMTPLVFVDGLVVAKCGPGPVPKVELRYGDHDYDVTKLVQDARSGELPPLSQAAKIIERVIESEMRKELDRAVHDLAANKVASDLLQKQLEEDLERTKKELAIEKSKRTHIGTDIRPGEAVYVPNPALKAVLAERYAQDVKWGNAPDRDLLAWMVILGKQYGQLQRCVFNAWSWRSRDSNLGAWNHDESMASALNEAVQLTACGLALVEALKAGRWHWSEKNP